MKKRKKYCAQRHLNSTQVMIQLEKAIRCFQDQAFENPAQVTAIHFHPSLCLVSISPDAKGYIPHKGWTDIRNTPFQGKYIAWVTEFSFRTTEDREDMLAVYKIKDGQKLIIPPKVVNTENIWRTFNFGKYRLSLKRSRYNRKKGNYDMTRYTIQTVR